ncbi:unnamed protein product [Periconia digitata]|uniref:Uncharacterized protein n=1 Tax=Periconia digitata TaxID=1303443 RepID=A0A9W4UIU7_9PLEO|nr:unnamed protein product [Periconia digitata]
MFAVSSQSWLEWLNTKRTTDPKFGPMMSGIPEMQKELLDRTATENMSRYRFHYFNVHSKISDRANRILSKNILERGYRKLRGTITDAFQVFKSTGINPIRVLVPKIVPIIFSEAERSSADRRLESLIDSWRWRWDIKWITFDYTLRTNGIPHRSVSKAYYRKIVNWNKEILDVMERPRQIEHQFTAPKKLIDAWKHSVINKLEDLAQEVRSRVKDLFKKVEDNIKTSKLSKTLMDRILQEWGDTEDDVHDLIGRFKKDLHRTTIAQYRKVTTEEDIGCIIAKLTKEPFREAQKEQRGKGVLEKQHKKLKSSLEGFISIYETHAIEMMREGLAQKTSRFLERLGKFLDVFIQNVEELFENNVGGDTKYLQAREKLQEWLPRYTRTIEELQSMFPAQESRVKDHSEQPPKRLKAEIVKSEEETKKI